MIRCAVVDETGWLRPPVGETAPEPRWGHPDGIQIGLHPLPGPRGLIRVYAPYLDHPPGRMINYIAVEPIPVGHTERGYSELERSRLDAVSGLRMWSMTGVVDPTTRAADRAYRGRADGDELRVHIGIEPFANGADVWLSVVFRRDDPTVITLAAHRRPTSVPLDRCILSATMGNWARLRRLELAGRSVSSLDLWPSHQSDGFTDHAVFPLSELARRPDGAAVVRARPDEADAAASRAYAPGTAEHWRYIGRPAAQEWSVADPHPELRAQVNGRYTYWMSDHPIPGGVAFENVELVEPFRSGREFTFRVTDIVDASAGDHRE